SAKWKNGLASRRGLISTRCSGRAVWVMTGPGARSTRPLRLSANSPTNFRWWRPWANASLTLCARIVCVFISFLSLMLLVGGLLVVGRKPVVQCTRAALSRAGTHVLVELTEAVLVVLPFDLLERYVRCELLGQPLVHLPAHLSEPV